MHRNKRLFSWRVDAVRVIAREVLAARRLRSELSDGSARVEHHGAHGLLDTPRCRCPAQLAPVPHHATTFSATDPQLPFLNHLLLTRSTSHAGSGVRNRGGPV